MERVAAMILAGGEGARLSVLVEERAKPAVPFGGRYRIIDYTLSSCSSSAVGYVSILTQYNPHSLVEHIGIGRPWDLDRKPSRVVLLQPFLSRKERDWYKGTADAVYQNLNFLQDTNADEVLVLAGDHIYLMRYDHAVAVHRRQKAEVTIAVTEVPENEISRFGIVTLDRRDRIVDFKEKPQTEMSRLASMGIYIFNKDVLIDCLEADARKDTSHDFGTDIIPEIVKQYKVYGYRFDGYWRDVGTVESYWRANMDLIVDLPELNLYDLQNVVRTVPENFAPAKFGPRAEISRSLICNGAIVNGKVENSVISPNVVIEQDAIVKDTIIFYATTIGHRTIVDRCIIDKHVVIGPECQVGYGDDYSINLEEPEYLNTGITLVGKGAQIPANVQIGRNCKIGRWVEASDIDVNPVRSGVSITSKSPKRHLM